MHVSDKPVSGCKFEPHGSHGGGNWIVTSDETGRICIYDLRKWSLSRVIYDSDAVNAKAANGVRWEGSRKTEAFRDVSISDEGWVCAVTEPGFMYSWEPGKDWEMAKMPSNVKATSMSLSRIA